jgi:hypothetical protein
VVRSTPSSGSTRKMSVTAFFRPRAPARRVVGQALSSGAAADAACGSPHDTSTASDRAEGQAAATEAVGDTHGGATSSSGANSGAVDLPNTVTSAVASTGVASSGEDNSAYGGAPCQQPSGPPMTRESRTAALRPPPRPRGAGVASDAVAGAGAAGTTTTRAWPWQSHGAPSSQQQPQLGRMWSLRRGQSPHERWARQFRAQVGTDIPHRTAASSVQCGRSEGSKGGGEPAAELPEEPPISSKSVGS